MSNKYKLDLTAPDGICEELEKCILEALCKLPVYLICAEGSRDDSHEKHYHIHAYVCSNYSRTDNVRSKIVRPAYMKAGFECTKRAVVIKAVTDLPGALSYVYKEKNVLASCGVMLESILPWKDKSSKLKKNFKKLTYRNMFAEIVSFCEQNGYSPRAWTEFSHVMREMMDNGYIFTSCKYAKDIFCQVTQYFGESRPTLAMWELQCNVPY